MLTWTPSKGETSFRPSKTVPDQAMSIQEILRRYASGQPIGGMKVPLYEGEDEFPDPNTMDLVDRQEYTEMVKNELKQINDQRQETLRSKQSALILPEPSNESQQDKNNILKKPPAEGAPGGNTQRVDSTNNP